MDSTNLQFPIGEFIPPESITTKQRDSWIDDLAALPRNLESMVVPLTKAQLDTRYRPDGWTVHQVVHHLADSHLNAYLRFKLALTMDNPSITPYPEAAWAELPDGREGPIAYSLDMLRGIHARWAACMRYMNDRQWKRTFFHSEHGKNFTLETTLGMYAWHGRHHLAHIELTL